MEASPQTPLQKARWLGGAPSLQGPLLFGPRLCAPRGRGRGPSPGLLYGHLCTSGPRGAARLPSEPCRSPRLLPGLSPVTSVMPTLKWDGFGTHFGSVCPVFFTDGAPSKPLASAPSWHALGLSCLVSVGWTCWLTPNEQTMAEVTARRF